MRYQRATPRWARLACVREPRPLRVSIGERLGLVQSDRLAVGKTFTDEWGEAWRVVSRTGLVLRAVDDRGRCRIRCLPVLR